MTTQDKKIVFQILHEECGPLNDVPGLLEMFIHQFPSPEFRFQGSLGFGGKVRYRDGNIRVDYYPEDETSSRRESKTRANERLENFCKKRNFFK